MMRETDEQRESLRRHIDEHEPGSGEGGKNPRATYDVGYLKQFMAGSGGATRWDNHGGFRNTAKFTAALVAQTPRSSPASQEGNGPRICDVGCGRGWIVFNLREMGLDACGCEYGRGAVAHSMGSAALCDLTQPGGLPYPGGIFDHVNCVGVLSHLPNEYAEMAVLELHRITAQGGTLWTNILTIRPDGEPNPLAEHHLNQETAAWWEILFAAIGWDDITADFADLYAAHGFGGTPEQMGRVWRKR